MAAVIGIAVGVVVVGAAIGCRLLFRARRAKGHGEISDSESGGNSSDSGEMTTTVAPVTMVDTQDLLSTRWAASAPGAVDSVFDQLSDEIC
jgi:hypothetical protein